ncbi:Vacuolar protein sorting-associated protein 51 [Haplosporangium bisporale]|nr:Vacuolar protein sorting-associated protein 51 [Haplosporangium bisporale]
MTMASGDALVHPLEAQSATTSAPPRSGTGTTTRRRAKSFLRNYYGIQQTDATNSDGTKENPSAQAGPVSKTDPYDLDSHSFEVDKYMHKIFVEKQLPGLIQTDNELVADIRQLDGDMKTLVYENYSKFLSATDTINKMKSNVDNLESEMSRLTQNIGKIATSSSAIHSSLGGKREKIRQLNGVHSLLTKLQFVFELPTNLHQCLEAESYTQAVKSYCRTLHLLQHYRHLTVFTGIERECKTIMVQIAQKIRQKMSVNCLRKVNTRTLEEMNSLPLYVASSVTSPKSAQGVPATPKKTPKKSIKTQTAKEGANTPKDSNIKATPPGDKVSYLNFHCLKQVEAFVTSFRSYFLSSASGLGGSMAGASDETAVEKAPMWTGKDARVQAGLSRDQDDVFNIQPEVHVYVLQNLYMAMTSSTGLCNLIGFDALATGLIQNWESKLIDRTLGKVKTELLEKIQDPKVDTVPTSTPRASLDVNYSHQQHLSANPEPSELGALMKDTIRWLLDIFKMDTIPFLEKCMGSDAQFLETAEGRALFLKIFQDGFKLFWDQVLQEMKQAALSTKSSARTSLVMSYLSFEMSNTVVEQLYKTLSKTIFRVGKRNRSGSFLIESYEEPPVIPQLQWDCKAVIKDCQESGHILLDGFIGRTGNDLSWLVMGVQSDTNYIAMESPTKVSAAWEQVYRQLNDIERLVITVYGDEGERGGNREVSSESTRRETVFKSLGGDLGSNSGNGSRVSHRNDSMASFGSNTMNSRFENQQRNMLLSNIDKLFSDRVEIFIRCQDLTRTGVMFGIIKILLKAWAESVRLRTFGRGGFQQVQVDAEFAKVWLWRFATADERLMYSLLEETQQTAYRRCVDPVPLDLTNVETIIGMGRVQD